jgi:N-terminal domain on NACHT_NTPase and P-loop NTPases
MAEAIAAVGLVSSIVQLVDFSAKVVTRLNSFASSISELPTTYRTVKLELPLVVDSLRRIREHAESGTLPQESVDAVEGIVEECSRQVQLLQDILNKALPAADDSSWRRRKKALLSLSKDKELEQISKSLGKYVTILTLHQSIEEPKPKQESAKSTFTTIPFDRNAHFVDREDIFRQIEKTLRTKEGSQSKAALCGLGGIG